MKKVVCFGLCFLIVLCSFAVCFADSSVPSPNILPQSITETSSLKLIGTDTYDFYFYSNNYPVYIVLYKVHNGENFRYLAFSEFEDTTLSRWRSDNDTTSIVTLSSEYNGFYYNSGALDVNTYTFYADVYDNPDNLGATAIIDSINDSVFGVGFDLSMIVGESVNWLSTFAQAVKNSGLLLFLVLIGFVGIGIGLFRRFVNG